MFCHRIFKWFEVFLLLLCRRNGENGKILAICATSSIKGNQTNKTNAKTQASSDICKRIDGRACVMLNVGMEKKEFEDAQEWLPRGKDFAKFRAQ